MSIALLGKDSIRYGISYNMEDSTRFIQYIAYQCFVGTSMDSTNSSELMLHATFRLIKLSCYGLLSFFLLAFYETLQ